jgi:uncharacterized membrane protein
MLEYVVGILTLLILDFLWIGLYMGGKYNVLISNIQGTKMTINPILGSAAYFLMIVGLTLFVIPNIRKGKIIEDSLLYGAVFGLVVYGVYDFTAGAVLEKWDIPISLQDVAWGAFVYFASAVAAGVAKHGIEGIE